MEPGLSPARQARAQHRHELRTLTYVTLDQANGGIVRNLTRDGIGVQVVAAVRPRQQLRVRFELRYPHLRVEARGEVVWATFSGQCGIRFLDVSPRLSRLISEWIFGSLLEGVALHAELLESMGARVTPQAIPSNSQKMGGSTGVQVSDGLTLSATPLKTIKLPTSESPQEAGALSDSSKAGLRESAQTDWLPQPLSGRGVAWTVHILVILAGLLLFALVFVSVTGEAPRWPLAVVSGAALFVAASYWGFFQICGGSSLGARLARLADSDFEDDEQPKSARFR